MSFRPGFTAISGPGTFERAFQQGLDLVMQDRVQRRLEAESQARIAQMDAAREDRRSEMSMRLLEMGARPLPEGASRADTQLARRLQEAGMEGLQITEPRFETRRGLAQSGVSGPAGAEVPTFSLTEQMERLSGGSRDAANNAPAMPEDASTVNVGDQRYAYSRTMQDAIRRQSAVDDIAAEREAGRREDMIDQRLPLGPRERALAEAIRQEFPEFADADDEVALALYTIRQAEQEAAPRPRGPDNTALRARTRWVQDAVEDRLLNEGITPDNTTADEYARIQAAYTAEAQAQYDARTPTEVGTAQAPGPGVSEEVLGADLPTEDDYFQMLDGINEDSLPSVASRIREDYVASSGPQRDLIKRNLLAAVERVWQQYGWNDPANRPGAGWVGDGGAIFKRTNTPLEVVDLLLGT